MPDPFEVFFAGYPPEVQDTSRKLRAMVKRAMPEAHEVLFASQNHIGYGWSESMRDSICYICPMRDYVRLGFFFGTQLADPKQLLVGTGQRMRHVKVKTVQEASNPALQALVESAWADALTHVKK